MATATRVTPRFTVSRRSTARKSAWALMSSPRARRSARAFNERASTVSSKSAVGDGPSSSSSAHPVPPVVLGNDDTARVSTGSCPPCVTRVKPTSNPEGNEDPWSSSFWVWRGLLATTVPPGTGGIAGPTTPFRRSRSAAAGLPDTQKKVSVFQTMCISGIGMSKQAGAMRPCGMSKQSEVITVPSSGRVYRDGLVNSHQR